jgi:hypothetical protein
MTDEPTEGGESEPDPGTIKDLKRTARSYANTLMKTRPLTEASQQHEDTMLTWSIGLMGAGLFALPTFMTAARGPGKRGLVVVAGPWVVGILLALLGRLVGGWHRDADRMRFSGKWGGIQALLLRHESSSPQELGDEISAIMQDRTESLREYTAKSKRMNWWVVRLYYATVVAFGIGIVAVFLWIGRCGL